MYSLILSTKGCEKVAVGSGITTVKCSCGHPFCFRCGDEAHEPCGCNQLVEWAHKCQNESETANWILANTRKCPACNARIEKNQGCNHMTCRHCRHEFCWVCMSKYVLLNEVLTWSDLPYLWWKCSFYVLYVFLYLLYYEYDLSMNFHVCMNRCIC